MAKDYIAIARQYEADILNGVIPACKWVRLACQRNARDLARQETSGFPYRFDAEAATRICAAAEMLPHVKGPKAKIVGRDDENRPIWNTIDLEPWQCWILTTLFGWLQGDGLRRFRVSLTLVPRKNAKSTIAAAVVLYMLTADGESGAECYSAATTRDQAKVVAEIAWEMAKRSPAFRDYFGVRLGAKTSLTLSVPADASKFAPLSADAHTLDALNVSLAVIDELHAHPTRGVWDVLDTATGARLQPLLFAITTAGVDIAGICYEKTSYLHRVLEGTVQDEQFFGLNYTIDEGDDWRDPATHQKANPNFAVSVSATDLARKAREAEQSPAAINNFLTKHCNVWVKGETTWMPSEKWAACAKPGLRIEDCLGHPAWIIVDLAEVRDIAATMALFRLDAGRYAVFGRYYLPQDTIETSPNSQYSGWVRTGRLVGTHGQVLDYQRIEDDVVAWAEEIGAEEILFDRALASRMLQHLEKRCGESPKIVVIGQNVQTIDPAMKHAEELVFGQKLEHDGDPVLAWMVSNVVAEPNHKGEIYPRKAGGKDSHNKIDGVFCLLMGLSRAMTKEPEPPAVAPGVSVLRW